jgi:hypothetical protein
MANQAKPIFDDVPEWPAHQAAAAIAKARGEA